MAPARRRSSSRSTRGARVFATAGTDEKVARCRELGADVAINYNDTDFAAVVLDATGNRGVDVVFDNVGEAVMEASMKSLAYNGRYLMMGFASNKEVADEPFIVPRRIALGNFKLCGVLLAYAPPDLAEMVKTAMGWNFASDELGAHVMREIVDSGEAGSVHAVVGDVVGLRGPSCGHGRDGEPRVSRPHDHPGRATGLTADRVPQLRDRCGRGRAVQLADVLGEQEAVEGVDEQRRGPLRDEVLVRRVEGRRAAPA